MDMGNILFQIRNKNGTIVDLSGGNITEYNTSNPVDKTVASPLIGHNAIGFDVNSRLVLTPTIPLLIGNGDFTLAFWLRSRGIGYWNDLLYSGHPDWMVTIGNRETSKIVNIMGTTVESPNNGGLRFYISPNEYYTESVYADRTWHHVAFTRKSGTMYCFVDGILLHSAPNTTYMFFTDIVGKQIEIGGSSVERNYALCGDMDDIILCDKALWTSSFSLPKTYVGEFLPFYIDEADTVWGIDSTATFKQLATNWSSKSDNDKLALMESIEGIPSISDLSTIGKFKVISMQEDTPITNSTVTAIPNQQTIYPTKLIKTAPFEKINSVSINATSSGAGDVKVTVTTDLSTYKVWDKVTLAWIDIPKADVDTKGMSIADVSVLTDVEWDKLVTYDVGDGIAFAYSMDITTDTDTAEIDELKLDVEMRGTWNKAVHGTDYDYGYPFYDLLRVKLLKDGSYKINYHD